MKGKAEVVGSKATTAIIKLTVTMTVETDHPYAVLEGLADAINYPDGGVIVRSIGAGYGQYLTANNCGRHIRNTLLEIGL